MSREYEQMVEDIKERTGATEEPRILHEIAEHGADTGWGGFTYTIECVEFYESHKDAIWEMLRDDAESLGYDEPMHMIANFGRADMADNEDGFKNLLAWYALEEVARRQSDELEDE